MPKMCVFDVNETLLDLSTLDPYFERVFGDDSARRGWFSQTLRSALVTTVTGPYSDFGTIGMSALKMTANRHSTNLSEQDMEALRFEMLKLSPYPDVLPGLQKLHDAGLRLAALTNSPKQSAETTITNAGLASLFESVMSADEVKRLKPAPEPYRMAAERLGTQTSGIRFTAAHAWDIAGAKRAGCTTAFLQRPGKVVDPLFEPPDLIASDLIDLADRILRAESG